MQNESFSFVYFKNFSAIKMKFSKVMSKSGVTFQDGKQRSTLTVLVYHDVSLKQYDGESAEVMKKCR